MRMYAGIGFLTCIMVGHAHAQDAARQLYEWLVPFRLREENVQGIAKNEAAKIIGTTTDGKNLSVYIGPLNQEMYTFLCVPMDKGGKFCRLVDKSKFAVPVQ